MLTVVLLLNELKPLIPGVVLTASSVPYFAGVISWWTISRLLPRRWYAVVDDVMHSCYQRFSLFVFANMSGVRMNLYGDVDHPNVRNSTERVLYISNHQCTVDWAIANMLALRQNSLGHVRYFVKQQLQYLPLYGFYFYMHGCVLVGRKERFQMDSAIKQLQYIAQLDQPSWIVIFPEGTRYSPRKVDVLEESQQFAKENSLEPLENVLMPRSRGVEMTLEMLRDRLDAVYDVTVAYGQTVDWEHGLLKPAPSMFEFVCSDPGTTVHVHLKRIPINEIPSDAASIRKWLYESFRKKDELLKEYYRKRLASRTPDAAADTFPDLKIRDASVPFTSTLPSALLISGFGLLPFLLTPTGRKMYAMITVLGTLYGIGYLRIAKVT